MRCIEEDWTVVWAEKVEVRCILELMARLEDDTLVVLLLLLGGRRLEGSDDCLECVNDADVGTTIWNGLPRRRRP